MKVAEATWQEIAEFTKDGLVIIPTGSLEQHGPYLPLITDTLIVTAVAEAVEARLKDQVLLLPTTWFGASTHHLSFAGSVSALATPYMTAIRQLIANYQAHGFRKFLVLNGHGGNVEPNRMALREAKAESRNDVFVHLSYYEMIEDLIGTTLKGPHKQMSHACEAEASLVLHLRPDLVRREKLRDDGMKAEGEIRGLILNFDEMSDEGSIGCATHASAETGKLLFEAAVDGCQAQIEKLLEGFVMVPLQ